MEPAVKRLKMTPPHASDQDDYVPLDSGTGADTFAANAFANAPHDAAPGHGGSHTRQRSYRFDDGRNAQDRPKSKHVLTNCTPWLLVKTRYRRQFVHNPVTKQSLWHIPANVLPAVRDFEQQQQQDRERAENTRWAEEQLQKMRPQSDGMQTKGTTDAQLASRRRRSESLQREDEAALMAELAAEEAPEGKQTAASVSAPQRSAQTLAPDTAYDSDSSYEEVEVTDSEGEDEEEAAQARESHVNEDRMEAEPDQPLEFGEDDIAFQLAAMGEDYDLDPDEYGDDQEAWDEVTDGFGLSEADAIGLFRDLLDDHQISPFTPFEKVIADVSESSILNDDRYTALTTMRARKDAFDGWVKDRAAELKQQRAIMEKSDPKIPYLDFLHRHATPKLYWPEFRRKYKREPELNDRKVSDKEREKLYRDHIIRLKLPETTRKADLLHLLRNTPLKLLNRHSSLETLPQQIIAHLHYISLAGPVRDALLESHIGRLPPPSPDADRTGERRAGDGENEAERRRREKAFAARERVIEDDR